VRILVAGALGEVGRTLGRALAERGHVVVPASGRAADSDLATLDYAQAEALLGEGTFDLVVNAAGRGDRRPGARTGQDATSALGPAVRATGVPAVLVSTTRVLEGAHSSPQEGDPPSPTTEYGRANAANEAAWLDETGPAGRVLRMANYFCAPSTRVAPQAELLPWSLVTEALETGGIVVRSGPGTTREFVSARDVAAAVEVLAGERPASGIAATVPATVLRLEDLVQATCLAFNDVGRPTPTWSFGTHEPAQPVCRGTWLAERGWHATVDAPSIRACITGWLSHGCLD
jgi:nucleoside-diphosphate-sugar epimerase